jgi:hypothetical protein
MQSARFASTCSAMGGQETRGRNVTRCAARAPLPGAGRRFLCHAAVQDDSGEDFFDVLDVSPADSAAEVRSAYVKAIREAHPDVAGSSLAATARAARLNEAYDTLSDPVKRGAYVQRQRGLSGNAGRSPAARRAQPGSRPGLVGPLRTTRLLTKLVPRQKGAVAVRRPCVCACVRVSSC